jgi:hypothetical protein
VISDLSVALSFGYTSRFMDVCRSGVKTLFDWLILIISLLIRSIVVCRLRCMSGYWCMWHRIVVAFEFSLCRFHLRSLAEGMVQNIGIAPAFLISDAVLFKVVESLARVVSGSSVYVISSYLGDIDLSLCVMSVYPAKK